MQKPDLYLLPGTMCSARLWQYVLPSVSSIFNINHIEYQETSSIELLIEQIEAQIPAEKPSHIIGFSLGGYLAVAIMARNKRTVASLVSLSNSATALPENEQRQRQQTLNWLSKFQYAGMPKNKIQAMLSGAHAEHIELHKIIRDMEKDVGLQNLVWQLSTTTHRHNHIDAVNAFTQPCLFAYGDEDKLVDEVWMSAIRQTSSRKIRQISGSGHMLPIEKPRLLSNTLSEFYNSISL